MTDVKKYYDAGREAIRMQAAQEGHKLLSETIADKGWDKRKSRQLLSEGKVSPQQYAAFENAIELVEQGVQEGKIHPSQRKYFLTDAINRPAEFEAMLKNAHPYINLTEHGLSGVDPSGRVLGSEQDKFNTDISQYMKDNKCSYTKAVKELHKKDPARAQRMRDEARPRTM